MPNVSVSEFVTFSDVMDSATKIGELVEALAMRESFDPHRYFDSISDTFPLNDVLAIGENRVINEELSDTLAFVDEAWPKYYSLDEFFFMWDWLELPNGLLYDTLTLSEDMQVWSGPALLDVLEFVDDVPYLADLVTPLDDEMTLVDTIHVYVNDRWRPMVPIPEVRS